MFVSYTDTSARTTPQCSSCSWGNCRHEWVVLPELTAGPPQCHFFVGRPTRYSIRIIEVFDTEAFHSLLQLEYYKICSTASNKCSFPRNAR